jgi:tRNA-uridine 2-sulfurtransferase
LEEKPNHFFVLGIDVKENIVYVGQGHDHPGLNRKGLFISQMKFTGSVRILLSNPGQTHKCKVRIRYRQALQDATLHMHENGLYIVFDQLQRGIAAGQFAAWYYDDEVVGSGVIS